VKEVNMNGAEILSKMLESCGTRYIFGVPGGHLLKFYDALYSSKDITSILTKHESGASFMATGYAQVSGVIGACTGTVGPGATNLTTGVASAYMDSVPVVVITAQVGSSAVGKGGLQEGTGQGRSIDHVELFNGMTKYSTRVPSVRKLSEMFRNAARTAVNGRPGPVHLDIMSEVFADELDVKEDVFTDVGRRYSLAGDLEAIEKTADLLLSTKNAAIIAGAGASGASELVKKLVETYRIPIATTLRAKGLIPEDHELSLGCVGIYGTNAANKYLRSGIDVLLAIGTSFGEMTSHAWDPRFQPKTALIQIDVDTWEIGKNYPVSVGIVGDTAQVLPSLIEAMKRKNEKAVIGKNDAIASLKRGREYYSDPKMLSSDIPLKPQRFMKSLRDTLPRDTIVFGDIGNTLPWLEGFFPSYESNTFFICSSLASMGYGVSASIGGQLAAPERQVVCICGDGDFQMQAMEIATAANYNIPVKWFILNNQLLAMISNLQDGLFKGRRISSEFINPDFVKLSEAMGAVGLRITKPEEIESVVKEALVNGRPTVVDVRIDANEAPSFDARAEAMARAWGTGVPLYQKLKMVPNVLKRL
jgi:acetolactate synthase I/II/III large subunit